MTKFGAILSRPVLISFLVFGMTPTPTVAGDLSKYRDFQLGTDLLTVAKKTGMNLSEAKVIHRRPALIQELQWYPQPLGPSSGSEPAKDVFFSFHNGELSQITINYDRHATEGLTAEDLVEALSATYGIATKPTALAMATQGRYGDQEEVLAQWEDPQYRFDLIRSSYGPSFRLIGVLKRLEAPAQAAIREAKRLDDQEAPERDAARRASEVEAAKAVLEKARLVNKPNFRP
jgi:hypothetical protein